MALAGIYIDKDGKCQPVDADGKNLPDAFAEEMKKYKLCKITVDRESDPKKVAKNLDAALAKWAADEAKNATTLGKATEKADKEFQKEKHDHHLQAALVSQAT